MTKKDIPADLKLSRRELFEKLDKELDEIKKNSEKINELSEDIEVIADNINELITILREGADGETVIDDGLPRARKHIEELRKQADTLERVVSRP